MFCTFFVINNKVSHYPHLRHTFSLDILAVLVTWDHMYVYMCIYFKVCHYHPSFRYTSVASCTEVSQLSQIYRGAAEVCGGR